MNFRPMLRPAVLLCLAAAPLAAQATPTPRDPSCEGAVVSRIDIAAGRPAFEGSASRWRSAARAIGLHHATTRARVIEAFLALHVGQPCTEFRREESERVLRAQPYLGDVSVRAVPDGPGRVAVLVQTVDEIPVLAAAQFRGLLPRSLMLGSSNVAGEGLRVELNAERGYAYRNGFGTRVVDYAILGRPYVATLEAQRSTLGYALGAAMEHPFFTDLQRIGWHVGFRSSDGYAGLRRPARDPVALEVRQERWDASSLVRAFGTSTVTLFGVAASGIRLTPADSGVVVSDQGLRPDTGTTLRNRYAPFKNTRLGVIGGVRRITYRTVRGFDGLTAVQDVASGVMGGVYVAHGLPTFGESDMFVSTALYGGHATEHVMMAALAQVEGRRDQDEGQWDSGIGSGHAVLSMGRPGLLVTLEDLFTGGTRSRLPLQLALGDAQGGMLGYGASSLAGARRNVARTDLRLTRAAFVRGADVAVAPFAEVGTIWAGDAPYGVDATRSAVGISLLAAYPSGSKRIYRMDVGIPLARGGAGGGRIEVRLTSEDRTQTFWREPDDVTRARTGPVPSSLFAWPTH
jgi:hypothetical protein